MLQKSASTKYLGVLLDSMINWADHINKTVEKTNKRLAGAMWWEHTGQIEHHL
jgi:hypothetical protein